MPPALRHRFQTSPLTIIFGKEEFLDGITIDHKTFYQKLAQTKELPRNSQATPDRFLVDSQELWDGDLRCTCLGSIIGTHAGPGAYGATFFCKE